MISWIVPFVQKNKDDPRSHTKQHESKYFRLAIDSTFEAKPTTGHEVGGVGVRAAIAWVSDEDFRARGVKFFSDYTHKVCFLP